MNRLTLVSFIKLTNAYKHTMERVLKKQIEYDPYSVFSSDKRKMIELFADTDDIGTEYDIEFELVERLCSSFLDGKLN